MKNLTVLALLVLLVSCQQPTKEVVPEIIGYDITEGVKAPLFAGDLANVQVWEKYIKAHNEKDLQTIQSLNAEKGFKVKGAKGEVFKSSEEHLNFLKNWFESDANPKWTTNFLIANTFTTKEGVLKQWVTSGHSLNLLVEGDTLKLNQVHDALIVNGKVQEFSVNERIVSE